MVRLCVPADPAPPGARGRPATGTGALRETEGADLRVSTCCSSKEALDRVVVADGGCENEPNTVNFGTPTISPVAHACVSSWVMMGTISGNRGLDEGYRKWTFPGEACGKEGALVREFAVDLLISGRSAFIH
jgi:hypothetical protein